MNQSEFNTDLDSYIGSRRKRRKIRITKTKKREMPKVENDKLPKDPSKVYMIRGKPMRAAPLSASRYSR